MAAGSAAPLKATSYAHQLPPRYAPPGEHRSQREWEPPPSAKSALDRIATLTTYRRGEHICGPGKTSASLHQVIAGVAKTFTLLLGGRQQTIDLLLPGDFFSRDTRDADILVVEALGKITIMAEYREQEIAMLAAHRPDVHAFLIDVAFCNASRLQRRMLTMSHLRTTQKVGAFLLELSKRLPERNAASVTPPVSRYDIADYLGLAVESVSRSLSRLKSEGAIRMIGTRQILITDRAALET
jgi:CRP-like cAMP-binding protein